MTKALTLSAAMAGLLFAGAAVAEEARSVVTVVTAPEPQTQLAAMVLSTQAVAQGADLHVLLCGPAGAMALSDAPESVTAPQPPRDMSPQGLLTGLIERGAKVEVCAIFLPGMGADASVLIDGVSVADPAAMARAMMAEGTAVWSF